MNFKKFMAPICAFAFVFSNLINVSAAPGDVVKAILLGDSKAGKTAIFYVLQIKDFRNIIIPTTKSVSVFLNFTYFKHWLNLCDVSGQEKYRGLALESCSGKDVAVIVVDSTNGDSIERIEMWWKIAKNIAIQAQRVV
jgi:GTPase SAR1 family protein